MELKWCQIFTPFFSQISWKKNMNLSFCPLPTYEGQSTYLLWPLLKLVMVFIKAFLFCILAITIKAGPSKRNFALCLIGDSRLQAKFGGLVAYIVAACKVVHEVFQHDNTSLAA